MSGLEYIVAGYGRAYRDDSVGAAGDRSTVSVSVTEQRGPLHHRKHHSTGHASTSSQQQGQSKLGSSATATSAKARMHGLLKEVEKEFEALCLENARLREKVTRLEKGEQAAGGEDRDAKNLADEPDQAFEAMLRSFTKKNALKTRRKLKQHTSKIVSSFRPPLLTASLVKEYRVRLRGVKIT